MARRRMARIYGTQAWRELAKRVIREEPVCRLRLPGVCTVRSTTADHIIGVYERPDLALVRSNVQGACRPCNTNRAGTPAHRLNELRRRLSGQSATPPKALEYFNVNTLTNRRNSRDDTGCIGA
jgi:5-methylcytosine-specific restriction endonuclease McrA